MKTSFALPKTGLLIAAACLLPLLPVQAADVELFGVFKGQTFKQSQAALASLQESERMNFYAFAQFANPAAILDGGLSRPDGTPVPIAPGEDPSDAEFDAHFDYLPELNAAYPNGAYQAVFETLNDGSHVVSLTLNGDAYPNPPFLSNFDAAQQIDPGSPFTLTWAPFIGGTLNDFIQLTVRDDQDQTLFDTAGPGEPGSLNGTSTSATLPARILDPNGTYTAELMFVRMVDFNDATYPGATGLAGYFKQTDFPLAAAGTNTVLQPALAASSPMNWQNDAPRNSVVAFRFNKPMRTPIAIRWSATVVPGDFACSWDADRQTLYCVYANLFPGDTLIEWTLNPDGASPRFEDLAGNALPTVSGQFTTRSEPPATPDVSELFLVKGRDYTQTQATPESLDYHFVGLYTDLNALNAVTNGTVQLPNGRIARLLGDDYGDTLDLEAEYASGSDLDAFIPDGTYALNLHTAHDGSRSFSLLLDGAQYPAAPTLLNLPNLAAIDPAADFPLAWAPFATGTPDDLIFVEINNDEGEDIFESGETVDLTGTATTLTLPAGTLTPGRTYQGVLRFIKVVASDDVSYPGVTALAAYVSSTRFVLATTGDPIRPRLDVVELANGMLHLRISGETKRTYTLEGTPHLGNPTQWQPIWTETAWDGSLEFFDWSLDFFPRRFYRVKEGWPDTPAD